MPKVEGVVVHRVDVGQLGVDVDDPVHVVNHRYRSLHWT
jgi:hypothetical protein